MSIKRESSLRYSNHCLRLQIQTNSSNRIFTSKLPNGRESDTKTLSKCLGLIKPELQTYVLNSAQMELPVRYEFTQLLKSPVLNSSVPKYLSSHNPDLEVKNTMVVKASSNFNSLITSFSDYRHIERHEISAYTDASDCSWMPESGIFQRSFWSNPVTEITQQDKVFVDEDGKTKIGEFGLAVFTRPFALLAPSISYAGFSRWMSPELVEFDLEGGAPEPTTASDIWALGCTIFEVSWLNLWRRTFITLRSFAHFIRLCQESFLTQSSSTNYE